MRITACELYLFSLLQLQLHVWVAKRVSSSCKYSTSLLRLVAMHCVRDMLKANLI